MEEGVAFDMGMTDNQYYGVIKMLMLVLDGCDSIEAAKRKFESLLREQDRNQSIESEKDI